MRTLFVALLPISLAISLASPAPIGGNGHPFSSSETELFDSSTPQRPPAAVEAKALFERLKRLQGKWKGTSTKGWSDRVLVQVIAGGSAILFDSFDAHPNEKMLTIVHFDQDRLLLTHYCVAGNQPRMQAASISDGGATFRFLDATNLPSRDTGHMDSVKFELRGDDRYTEQWSWYQKGQERWMEQIEMVRLPEPPVAGP